MADSKSVSLPAHLAQVLDQMVRDLGTPREALLSQAVSMFARLNGYAVPGDKGKGPVSNEVKGGSPHGKIDPHARPAIGRSSSLTAAIKAAAALAASMASDDSAGRGKGRAPNRPPKGMARNTVTGLPPGKARPPPKPEPEPELELELDTNRLLDMGPVDDGGNAFEVQAGGPAGEGPLTLVLFRAGHEPKTMEGDTLTIGREAGCDYVIDSERVSRGHARVTRSGNTFFFEDLGSSNGSYFGPNGERVTRREIENNDEFVLGTEKICFQLRK